MMRGSLLRRVLGAGALLGAVLGSRTSEAVAPGPKAPVINTSTRTACVGCGTGTGYVLTSTDGANWTVAGTTTGLNAVNYGPTGFVGVGLGGGTPPRLTA